MGMRLNQAGNQVPGQGMSTALSEEEKKKQQEAQQEPQISQLSSPSSQANIAQAAAPKAAPKQQAAGTGTFSNLKSYLQAAQGGGQQKVAQAATQKVQSVATGAQKGISQASQTFGKQLEAGSLANMGAAGQDVQAAINAARNVTYQAPQTTQATTEVQPIQESSTIVQTPVVPSPAEVTPEQAQRFQDIINARYAGPGSLQEAGLYNRAAEKAKTAQEAVKQTQTAAGREQLLKNIFSQGRDYSRGQSKLDALLLNTSQQGVGQLQQQAQQAGDLQQKLQQAQTESANLATGRTKEISDIQQQARKSFLEGRTSEEASTEKSIDALIKDPALDASRNPIPKLDSTGKPMVDAKGDPIYQTKWDQLPEYYRDVIRNKEATNKAIQAERLAGLETSTGLNEAGYNTALKNVQAQEKALQDARNVNLARSMAGLSLDPEAEARVEAATARLESSKKALAGYSDFATQLKDIKNMNMGQLSLTPEEAAVLGISSGEGLYNIGQDLIQDVNAERGRLITKDQFARQQALARLAGLDTSKALQKDLMYTDAEKAGTQTLASSLNTEAIRNALNKAEKDFREEAAAKTITGSGSKKNKTSGKRYYASEDANVKNVLSKAGYDFNAPLNEQIGNINASGKTTYDQDPNSLLGLSPNIGGTGIAQGYGNVVGTVTGLNAITNALGLGGVGDAIGGLFGGGTSSRESKSDAARFAREDLQKRLNQYLQDKGFQNRANVGTTEATSARSAALQELLRRQG